MAIKITKSSGEMVPYDEEKVRRSVSRTGADEKTIAAILHEVQKALKPGMGTKEIYAIVRKGLRKEKPWAAARYNLRAAIVRMGPTGFNFEKYVSSILNAYGYRAETPDSYMGACIRHEVDVTAEKEGRTAFIEAKFRRNFETTITIKDVLATWARYLDLVDGARIGQCPHFDEAWVVTNARFTDQCLKYGHCKNMVLIGWNHPRERTLAMMVDLNALYPLTVIDELTEDELSAFSRAGLMLCREVAQLPLEEVKQATGIANERLETIAEICTGVVNGDHPSPLDEIA